METTMTIETIFSGDSLVLKVPTTFASGAPVSSLSGATIRASAFNGVSVDATTSLVGDTITCTWPAGSLRAGIWQIQVQATKAGLTQTVATETFQVMPTNPAAS